MRRVFKKLRARGLHLQHVCQVGVYLPERCAVADFIRAGIRCTLVEAEPLMVARLRQLFPHKNVALQEVIPGDEARTVSRPVQHFQKDVFLPDNPSLSNDGLRVMEEFVELRMEPFSAIDAGDIEWLHLESLTTQWTVLKHLCSRPLLISLTTDRRHPQPHQQEVLEWFRAHDYLLWYADRGGILYMKQGLFRKTTAQKMHHLLSLARAGQR